MLLHSAAAAPAAAAPASRERLGEDVFAGHFAEASALPAALPDLAEDPTSGLPPSIRGVAMVPGAAGIAERVRPTHLLVFDIGGITGHPDHEAATNAALTAAETLGLPVVTWAVPQPVADALDAEFGTNFLGRPDSDIDWRLSVDRARQHAAIAAHASRSTENPVPWRRLELTGDAASLRLFQGGQEKLGARAGGYLPVEDPASVRVHTNAT